MKKWLARLWAEMWDDHPYVDQWGHCWTDADRERYEELVALHR